MLVMTMALIAAPAFAQDSQPAAPVVEASTTCFATFNIGPISYCVSEHGNIAKFTAPAVAPEHIRIGVIREGYTLCATNPAGVVQISHDAGDVEAGFNVPVTISQPFGANTLPLTITRTTTSGLELVQSFAHNAAHREVEITMTVRNVSGQVRNNVRVDRYFDGDIAGTAGNDRYTRSADGVWGEEGLHTMMLSDITSPTFPAVAHTTAVQTFAGFVPASCGQASIAVPTAAGDFVGRLSYSLGNMAANASKTLRVQYRKL
jgi:hypothetical protein